MNRPLTREADLVSELDTSGGKEAPEPPEKSLSDAMPSLSPWKRRYRTGKDDNLVSFLCRLVRVLSPSV